MDELKYNFDEEYKDVIEEITKKYGYNNELKRVLTQIAKAIVSGKNYEDRQTFYETLRTTPIIVIPRDLHMSKDEICNKMFGGDLNPHIKSKQIDRGDYDKTEASGSFVSQPVFDENLNIVDVKKFIFVKGFDTTQELSGKDKEYFNIFETGINVSHLIHELGHAYASQKHQCQMDGNILTIRAGVCEIKTKYTPIGDGEYESENISTTGLFLEEGLNTNFEEETLAKYLGVSLEEVKKLYRTVLNPSFYQQGISAMTENLNHPLFKKDIDNWRFNADKNALSKISDTFSQANYYEKREKLYKRDKSISPNTDGNIDVQKNRVFNDIHNLSKNSSEVLHELETSFFPDSKNMTPIDMLDNILMQYYNLGLRVFTLPMDKYVDLFKVVTAEGGGYIYQAAQIRSAEKQLQIGEK